MTSTETASLSKTVTRTEYGLRFPDDDAQAPYLTAYGDRPQAEAVAVDHPGSQIVQRTVTTITRPWADSAAAAADGTGA